MRMLTIAALLLGGCGLGSASLDEPSICKTVKDVAVPAVPAQVPLHDVTLPLQVDLRPELATLGVKSGHAHLISVTLEPVDGVQNLDFIQQVTLSENSGAALLTFSGATGITATGTGADLFPDALNGPLELQLALTGTLPDVAWHVDVQACIDVQATVSP
jgi:hypothetical protein